MKRHSQRGIALILTLILLSIITFLTLAFLALSRREKGAVNVNLDQTRAQQAAEAGAERAKAQIIAQILATTNKWAYDLMVSTSYQNTNGFNAAPGPGLTSVTNVSYTYPNGAPLTNGADFVQNAANLFYDPRPPVFVETNATGPLDFRYYLDLNRNGFHDANGPITLIGPNGLPLLVNNQPVVQSVVGDPEYVGIAEKLELPHSATNRFLERYAYIVLPAGKTLDMNFAHNQAKKSLSAALPDPAGEGYLRNEGMGTWELNLAAALEDLNTNYWGSTLTAPNYYNPSVNPIVTASSGLAYMDALALLRYRYNGTYQTLPTARQTFGPACGFFLTDLLDEYGNGPIRTNAVAFNADLNDNIDRPWPGGENTNAFFNHQGLFDTNMTGRYVPPMQTTTFSDRLFRAGTNVNSYDRYTFYRLLSTLGLDSGPEPAGKININFVNVDGISETNLAPWAPVDFFTNAIDRLLRDNRLHPYANLSATNIPIYPTNYYSPAVHRLLQVTANIYDATHTNAFPTVFRPLFDHRGTEVFISGWAEVIDPAEVLNAIYRNLQIPTDLAAVQPRDMVVGVPLVIGAKKGLPNFNEFAMQTIFQAGRKLELRRVNTNSLPNETNQVYFVGISNLFGLEAWNSYRSNYPRPLQMQAHLSLTWSLTNEVGVLYQTNYVFPQGGQPWHQFPVIPANGWLASPANGRAYSAVTNGSFRVPVAGGLIVLSNSAYLQLPTGGGVFGDINSPLPRNQMFPVPRLWMTTSAQVRYALVDTSQNPSRLVDFVNLAQLDRTVDLTAQLMSISSGDEPGAAASQWRTNRIGGQTVNYPTEGIISQLQVSLGNTAMDLQDWKSYGGNSGNLRDKEKAIDAFRSFFKLTPLSTLGQLSPPIVTNLSIQFPYNPVRKLSFTSTWQANDPLVHYLPGDLSYLAKTNDFELVTPPNSPPTRMLSNLGRLNTRTQPWGGNSDQATDTNKFRLELKDPGVFRSDDWEFPNGPFANVGWLGRVHRGSPWQTVYLKDTLTNPEQWQAWSGNNFQLATNTFFRLDSESSRPITDRALLEHFTATFDSRTTRGQVSVNNTNLAAWSAVLTGVFVMSNSLPDAAFGDIYLPAQFQPVPIESAGHAGTNSPLGRIVAGINRARATNTTFFPQQVFTQLGDILLVPELTTRSPFLFNSELQLQRGLTDAAVERIPQQILGLLRGEDDPRFVIYAYGQALRPAANSLVVGGPYNRLCTNYAITAEAAFRTVIRVVGAPNEPRAIVESFNFLPPD